MKSLIVIICNLHTLKFSERPSYLMQSQENDSIYLSCVRVHACVCMQACVRACISTSVCLSVTSAFLDYEKITVQCLNQSYRNGIQTSTLNMAMTSLMLEVSVITADVTRVMLFSCSISWKPLICCKQKQPWDQSVIMPGNWMVDGDGITERKHVSNQEVLQSDNINDKG